MVAVLVLVGMMTIMTKMRVRVMITINEVHGKRAPFDP
jgi:hypothetical protein